MYDSLAIIKAVNLSVVDFQGKYFHLSTQQTGYEITLNANKGFDRYSCHGSAQVLPWGPACDGYLPVTVVFK